MDVSIGTFESHRGRLFGIAYRMLGSKADAEDVLQDAYLRWHGADRDAVRSAEAWLTATVTRLAIDRLRHAKVERDSYVGPWLPEPLCTADMQTPELAAELDSDMSIAFLALLEALAPDERAAFVLHDIFDDDYADIAETLGKSTAACRQMVHRARERVMSRRRRFLVDDATRIAMLEKFMAAASRGDRQALVSLFAQDATMISDGGGKVTALLRPVYGAQRIAWLWYAIARRRGRMEREIVYANGEPALALMVDGRAHSISVIETDGRVIHGYYSILNPDKLRAFA